MLQGLAFYLLATVAVVSALLVVTARNPVHSVLFLILAFVNAAGLFILMGAEFLGMMLIVVYVGAVAVLFLFVIMMLDVDFVELREGFIQYLPIGIVIGGIFLFELLLVVGAWVINPQVTKTITAAIPTNVSNTEALGLVLYTKYIHYFQLAGMVLLVALTLFARHFLGAIGVSPTGARGVLETLDNALSAAWGGIFNGLSYLTTTGWNSVEWQGARNWSGLSSPGLILAGLAMMGGGVATTAGGVKLLRVYALARHSQRELEKIVHPNSVGGGGLMARRLRNEGAYLAFIFFMLFASSIAVVIMLISLQGIEFDSATILSIAALTNTGPLAGAIPMVPTFQGSAGLAGAPWEGWAGLPGLTKAILAGAMIAGRVETLAILALLSPEYWRR